MRRRFKARSGAAILEFAIVAPALILLIAGTLVAAMGVFRYQQISWLAREASRYASVHGAEYHTETGLPAATSSSIYSTIIQPKGVALDLSKLNYSITWNSSNAQFHTTVNGSGQLAPVTNTVRVTITYRWVPEMFFSGVTLTSTSETPMSF